MDAESDDEGEAHLQNSDIEQAPDDILWPTSTWNLALGEKLPSLPRFEGQPSLKIDLNGHNSPSNYFDLFGDDAIIENIVAETNRYASQALQGWTLPPSSHTREWIPVTLIEMRAFLGIIVAMGLVQQRHLTDYWSQDDIINTSFFRNLMARNRFKLNLQFHHLNNSELSMKFAIREMDSVINSRSTEGSKTRFQRMELPMLLWCDWWLHCSINAIDIHWQLIHIPLFCYKTFTARKRSLVAHSGVRKRVCPLSLKLRNWQKITWQWY